MLKKLKKSLRQSQTDAESQLWYNLRNRNLDHYIFRRQHVLYGCIVDFVCLEKKLVIELDDGQHALNIKYDEKRTLKLQSEGFQVLRFWNNEVFDDMGTVLEIIYQTLNTPHPRASHATSPTRGEVKKQAILPTNIHAK